jgi:hypothetical protein
VLCDKICALFVAGSTRAGFTPIPLQGFEGDGYTKQDWWSMAVAMNIAMDTFVVERLDGTG